MSESNFSMVLLLGSYDTNTKNALNRVKDEIAKQFSGKPYAFFLANVEIYMTDRFQILTETEEDKRLTLYLFEDNLIYDIYDLPFSKGQDQKQLVYKFLSERFGVSVVKRQPLAQKFEWLMTLSKRIFLIREEELTRGGEYVELMHILFTGKGEKLWLFSKKSVELSSMLMEYLDLFQVKMRSYSDINNLLVGILRTLEYL